MKKLFILVSVLCLSACASSKVDVIVDTPDVPVYIPSPVASQKVYLHVKKDDNGNNLYTFDESNFLKLKKLLIDVTKNNQFTNKALCYYNKSVCEKK